MAAVNLCRADRPALRARTLMALIFGTVLAAVPAASSAEDAPARTAPVGLPAANTPADSPPTTAQPKPPAPGEVKTGVIRPPDVDPDMAKPVPNVDPKMPKPPKPQAPTPPQNQGDGKSPPEVQPR